MKWGDAFYTLKIHLKKHSVKQLLMYTPAAYDHLNNCHCILAFCILSLSIIAFHCLYFKSHFLFKIKLEIKPYCFEQDNLFYEFCIVFYLVYYFISY